MHYLSYAVIDRSEGDDLEALVTKCLAPYEEQYQEDGEEFVKGFWDWWQIGGRWTGYFDGYDPENDPSNRQVCDLCNGTGRRDDEIGQDARKRDPNYTCNGCSGKGERARWPTSWVRHDGDVMPLDDLPEDKLVPYVLFVSPTEAIAKAEIWKHPEFKGWPDQGTDEKDEKRAAYDALGEKITKEHIERVKARMAELKGKNLHVVVVDFHS